MTLPLILLGILICLFPLGLYCVYLAQVNSRPHPLMLPGTWDFVGVVAAVSGFLLFGGPVAALAANTAFRAQMSYANFTKLAERAHDPSGFTYLILVAYAATVLIWLAVVLSHRRAITSIYNVDTNQLDDQLTTVAEDLAFTLQRRGPVYSWTRGTAGATSAVFRPIDAVLEIERTPGLCHANLRWTSDDGTIRHDVEAALRNVLATAPAPTNPVAGRLATVATCMFLTMMFSLGLLILYTYLLRGR